MLKRKFGASSTMVPIIGQGSWNFAEGAKAVEQAKQALKKGMELKATHIDTAEMYGDGHSEKIIGEAIAGFPRQELFIVSKVLPSNATYKGTINACEASLRRMRLDYLDCYLLHWRGSHPLEATMSALEKLVEDGKIRTLGVSNFDVDDLEEAASYLNKATIACNQVLYNLKERAIEKRLIPYCRKHNIAVVGYTPFGYIPSVGKDSEVLKKIAAKYDASVSQIILSFLVRLEELFAIPKATRLEHAVENAAAGDIILEPDDIKAIDAAFPAPSYEKPLAIG